MFPFYSSFLGSSCVKIGIEKDGSFDFLMDRCSLEGEPSSGELAKKIGGIMRALFSRLSLRVLLSFKI